LAALAVETGIPPHVLEDTDWVYLEAMADHLKAKAAALSGSEDDVDWDEMFGGDDG
jgi:hypothetical protein